MIPTGNQSGSQAGNQSDSQEVLTPWRKARWGTKERLAIIADKEHGVRAQVIKQNLFAQMVATFAKIFGKTTQEADKLLVNIDEKTFNHVTEKDFLEHKDRVMALCEPINKRAKEIRNEIESALKKIETPLADAKPEPVAVSEQVGNQEKAGSEVENERKLPPLVPEEPIQAELQAPPTLAGVLPADLPDPTIEPPQNAAVPDITAVDQELGGSKDDTEERFVALNKEIGLLTETVTHLMGRVNELQPSLKAEELEQRRTPLTALQQQLELLLQQVAAEEIRVREQGRFGLLTLIQDVKQSAASALENLAALAQEVENPRLKTKHLNVKLETIQTTREQLTRNLTDLRQVKAECSILLQRADKFEAGLQRYSTEAHAKWQPAIQEWCSQIKSASSLKEVNQHEADLDALLAQFAKEFRSEVLAELAQGKAALSAQMKKAAVPYSNKALQTAVHELKQNLYARRMRVLEELEKAGTEQEYERDLDLMRSWKSSVAQATAYNQHLIPMLNLPLDESSLKKLSWYEALQSKIFGPSKNPFKVADNAYQATFAYTHKFTTLAVEEAIEALNDIDSLDKYVLLQKFRIVLHQKNVSLEQLSTLIDELSAFQQSCAEKDPAGAAQLKAVVDRMGDLKQDIELLLERYEEIQGLLMKVAEQRRKVICPSGSHPTLVRLSNQIRAAWNSPQKGTLNLFEMETKNNAWWQSGIAFMNRLDALAPIARAQKEYQKLERELEARLFTSLQSVPGEINKEALTGAEKGAAGQLYVKVCRQLSLDTAADSINGGFYSEQERIDNPVDLLLDPLFADSYMRNLKALKAQAGKIYASEAEKQRAREGINKKIDLQLIICSKTQQKIDMLEEKVASLTGFESVKFPTLRKGVDERVEKLKKLKEQNSNGEMIIAELSKQELNSYEKWVVIPEISKVQKELREKFDITKACKTVEALVALEKSSEQLAEEFTKKDKIQLMLAAQLRRDVKKAKENFAIALGLKDSYIVSTIKGVFKKGAAKLTKAEPLISAAQIDKQLIIAKQAMNLTVNKFKRAHDLDLLKQISYFKEQPDQQYTLILSFMNRMDQKVAEVAQQMQDEVAKFEKYEALKEEANALCERSTQKLKIAKDELFKKTPLFAEMQAQAAESNEPDRMLYGALLNLERSKMSYARTAADAVFSQLKWGQIKSGWDFGPTTLSAVAQELSIYEKKVEVQKTKGLLTLKSLIAAQKGYERATEKLKEKLKNAMSNVGILQKNPEFLGGQRRPPQILAAWELKKCADEISDLYGLLRSGEKATPSTWMEWASSLASMPKEWLHTGMDLLHKRKEWLLSFVQEPSTKLVQLEKYVVQLSKWISKLEATNRAKQRIQETIPQQLKRLARMNMDPALQDDLKEALHKAYREWIDQKTSDMLDPDTGQFATTQALLDHELAQYITPGGTLWGRIYTALNVQMNELNEIKEQFAPKTLLNLYGWLSWEQPIELLSAAGLEQHESALATKHAQALASVMKDYPINKLNEQRVALERAMDKALNRAGKEKSLGQLFTAVELEQKVDSIKNTLSQQWDGKVKEVAHIRKLTTVLKDYVQEMERFYEGKKKQHLEPFDQLEKFSEKRIAVDNYVLEELRSKVIEEMRNKTDKYAEKLNEMKDAVVELRDFYSFPYRDCSSCAASINRNLTDFEKYKYRFPLSGTINRLLRTEKAWDEMNVEELVEYKPIRYMEQKHRKDLTAIAQNPAVGRAVTKLLDYKKELKEAKEKVKELREESPVPQLEYARNLDRIIRGMESVADARNQYKVLGYVPVNLRKVYDYVPETLKGVTSVLSQIDDYVPTGLSNVDRMLRPPELTPPEQAKMVENFGRWAEELRTQTKKYVDAPKLSAAQQMLPPDSKEAQELKGYLAKEMHESADKLQETVAKYKEVIGDLVNTVGLPVKWENALSQLLETAQQIKGEGISATQEDLGNLANKFIAKLNHKELGNHKGKLDQIKRQLKGFEDRYHINDLKDACDRYKNANSQVRKDEESYREKHLFESAKNLKTFLNNAQKRLKDYFADTEINNERKNLPDAEKMKEEMFDLVNCVLTIAMEAQNTLHKEEDAKKPSLLDIVKNKDLKDNTPEFFKVRRMVLDECRKKLDDSLSRVTDYDNMKKKVEETLSKFDRDKKFRFTASWAQFLDRTIKDQKQVLSDMKSLEELDKDDLMKFIKRVDLVTADKIDNNRNFHKIVNVLEDSTHLKTLSDELKNFNEAIEQIERAVRASSAKMDRLQKQAQFAIQQERALIGRGLADAKRPGDITGTIIEIVRSTAALQKMLSLWQVESENARTTGTAPDRNLILAQTRILLYVRTALEYQLPLTLPNKQGKSVAGIPENAVVLLSRTLPLFMTIVGEVIYDINQRDQAITAALNQQPQDRTHLTTVQQQLQASFANFKQIYGHPKQQDFPKKEDFEKYVKNCQESIGSAFNTYNSACNEHNLFGKFPNVISLDRKIEHLDNLTLPLFMTIVGDVINDLNLRNQAITAALNKEPQDRTHLTTMQQRLQASLAELKQISGHPKEPLFLKGKPELHKKEDIEDIEKYFRNCQNSIYSTFETYNFTRNDLFGNFQNVISLDRKIEHLDNLIDGVLTRRPDGKFVQPDDPPESPGGGPPPSSGSGPDGTQPKSSSSGTGNTGGGTRGPGGGSQQQQGTGRGSSATGSGSAKTNTASKSSSSAKSNTASTSSSSTKTSTADTSSSSTKTSTASTSDRRPQQQGTTTVASDTNSSSSSSNSSAAAGSNPPPGDFITDEDLVKFENTSRTEFRGVNLMVPADDLGAHLDVKYDKDPEVILIPPVTVCTGPEINNPLAEAIIHFDLNNDHCSYQEALIKKPQAKFVFIPVLASEHYTGIVYNLQEKELLHYNPKKALNKLKNPVTQHILEYFTKKYDAEAKKEKGRPVQLKENGKRHQNDAWSCSFRVVHFFDWIKNKLSLEDFDKSVIPIKKYHRAINNYHNDLRERAIQNDLRERTAPSGYEETYKIYKQLRGKSDKECVDKLVEHIKDVSAIGGRDGNKDLLKTVFAFLSPEHGQDSIIEKLVNALRADHSFSSSEKSRGILHQYLMEIKNEKKRAVKEFLETWEFLSNAPLKPQ